MCLPALPAFLVGTAATGTTAATAGLIGTAGAITGGGLATAAALGGSVLSASSAIQQGNYANKVAENNALSAQYAADDARARGAVEEQRTRDRTRAVIGAQRAALAANGIDTTTGTGSLLLQDTAAGGEFDALTVRNNAMKQAYGLNTQATNLMAEGKATQTASKGQAVGSLLTGGSRAYSIYKGQR